MRVYTCIVGDLFHAGHVNFLRQAKAEGTFLIVGVCSDEECIEKKRRTIMTFKERVAVIEACKYVDEIIEAPPSVIDQQFMNGHQIDLIVHGDDNNLAQLLHFYEPAILQGKYKSLPYTKSISTTEIIARIKSRSDEELQRKYFLQHLKSQ
jgi:ethanolamine-phosphate cytidylyltransferase/choline-phosphate cytidylyltransferase